MNEKELKKILNLSLSERLNRYNKKARVLKKYVIERWGTMPCPLRLVVNPYISCSFQCRYCYVWCSKPKIYAKDNFREALKKDILRYKTFQLEKFAVEISPSTDPLQEIESEFNYTFFAAEELLKEGFKVVIVTKNPGRLLDKKYSEIIKNKSFAVDVTITSLGENSKESPFLNNNGPSPKKKLDDIKSLINKGVDVRLRIDPVLPFMEGGNVSQNSEDLKILVRKAAEVRIKLIISKTMRLNEGMPSHIKEAYLKIYQEKGSVFGENYILSREERKRLLLPIYEECIKQGIQFCPCCDVDSFSKVNTNSCRIAKETKVLNSEIL